MLPKLRNTTILLVEDNQSDIDLILKAFEDYLLANKVEVVGSGEAALDYLLGCGSYAERDPKDQPQLILLDLILPRQSGIETLRQIRAHELTRFIPVVMLTQSAADEDRLAAYAYQSNSYIRKPVDGTAFKDTVQAIGLYWLLLNQPAHVAPAFSSRLHFS